MLILASVAAVVRYSPKAPIAVSESAGKVGFPFIFRSIKGVVESRESLIGQRKNTLGVPESLDLVFFPPFASRCLHHPQERLDCCLRGGRRRVKADQRLYDCSSALHMHVRDAEH